MSEHTNDDERGQGNNLVAEPNSVVSRLRELRESFGSDDTIDLPVPGYRGELIARYAPLAWEVVRAIALRGERSKRDPNIGPTLAADGLANAIVGFFFRDTIDPDADLTAVTWQGDPVTAYDPALASVLGLKDAETTREIVKATFPDEFALVAHYGTFMEWQAERDDADADLIEAAKVDTGIHPTSS